MEVHEFTAQTYHDSIFSWLHVYLGSLDNCLFSIRSNDGYVVYPGMFNCAVVCGTQAAMTLP